MTEPMTEERLAEMEQCLRDGEYLFKPKTILFLNELIAEVRRLRTLKNALGPLVELVRRYDELDTTEQGFQASSPDGVALDPDGDLPLGFGRRVVALLREVDDE